MAGLTDFALRFVHGPLNRGPMEDATHYGESDRPGDGPYVRIWLKIEDGIIKKAAFKSPGCPSSTATAGALCAVITGCGVGVVAALTPQDLLTLVGELPDGKGHYVERSLKALRFSISSPIGAAPEVSQTLQMEESQG